MALAVAGVGIFATRHAEAAVTVPIAAPARPAVQTVVTLPDFAQITQRNGPAVVNITVSGLKKTIDNGDAASGQQGMPGIDPNDPFFQFFRQFQGQFGMRAPQEVPVRGEGSGFIISPDGIILTNAHVVRDAKRVTVKLTDRREFEAKVLGSDPLTDVAVLKIDAKNLPTVTLGSARNLQVGQWVLAIGSPFGFENSASAGIVSAKGRSLPDDSYVPFIQTDVAVNPGNSGGPLFDANGDVVGINAQIYTRTGGFEGLSFAIPIDTAARVKDEILAHGKVEHARLGVAIQEVNQTLADSFKLAKPEGALISNVDNGGPADKAGLKPGDVILKMDGKPIIASGDLPTLIGEAQPGDKAKLEVWHQGKREEITARLGNANDKPTQLAEAGGAAGKGKLGLALRPLQPQEKQQDGVDNGLLIERVTGPAAMAGVQSGDVLLAVNGTPIRSVQQVREIVAQSGKSVALLIQRGDAKIFVPVRIG
ncbi:MAG: Do family serine endopeptidase [Betaproteobacteria bacterium]|nr:Do family serine endopeptidase [Betaproteobacteria bacterium]